MTGDPAVDPAEDLTGDLQGTRQERIRASIQLQKNRSPLEKALWILGGIGFVAIGAIGIVIPGLPTTPLLLLAAAATGVLTVVLIEALIRTRLVPEDASIGIVFPALFSIGVILISRGASGVHLDTDAVLLGELAFAPFHRLTVAGVDLGPAALWSMGTILVVNAALVVLAWKELKLATVDASLAALLGFHAG